MALIGTITARHFLDGEVFTLNEKEIELEKLLRRREQIISELERMPERVVSLNEEITRLTEIIEVTHGRETSHPTDAGLGEGRPEDSQNPSNDG